MIGNERKQFLLPPCKKTAYHHLGCLFTLALNNLYKCTQLALIWLD